MTTRPNGSGQARQAWQAAGWRRRAPWREVGAGTLGRSLFLATAVGLGLGALEPFAAEAVTRATRPALPAAAVCPQGTALEPLLPPGHPPVPGLGGVPRLPPGHPPIGAAPGAALFPQDEPRTL